MVARGCVYILLRVPGEEELRLLWSDSPIARVPGIAFFFSGPKPGLPPVLQVRPSDSDCAPVGFCHQERSMASKLQSQPELKFCCSADCLRNYIDNHRPSSIAAVLFVSVFADTLFVLGCTLPFTRPALCVCSTF